jgi:hypothetical protein
VPSVNATPLPTQVFVAITTSGVTSVVNLQNQGTQTMFVGLAACTPNTGLPLSPGERIRLNNVTKSLYACANWAAGTAAATLSTSASATVGTTSWTVASGGMANIPVGTYFTIGSGSGQEVLNVATSASTTTITTTTGSLFEHYASETLNSVTWTPAPLNIQRGTSLPVQLGGALAPSGQ